jgi:hypothetical protein
MSCFRHPLRHFASGAGLQTVAHNCYTIWAADGVAEQSINSIAYKTQLYLDNRGYVSTKATCFDLGQVILKLTTILKTHIK